MPTFTEVRHGDDGFTLVELLVAMTLSIVILLATLQSFDVFSSDAAQQTRQADASDQVRTTMDRTVRDLRGASVLLTAAADNLVYTVPETSGVRTERLCLSGGQLYGWETITPTTPAAPTTACSSLTKVATLKPNVTTAFTYDGAPSSATPALVRNVGLTFSLASGSGRTGSSTLTASAARRSAGTLVLNPGGFVPTCNSTTGALLDISAALPSNAGTVTVTYATTGGVALGVGTGASPRQVTIPPGLTTIVATITDALGATNTLKKDVICN